MDNAPAPSYKWIMTNTNSDSTATTITVGQIRALREEALAHGDAHMADWCSLALSPREHTNDDGSVLVAPSGRAVTRSRAREIVALALAARD